MNAYGMSRQIVLEPERRSTEVLEFEKELRKKIIGQDEAVAQLVNVYQTVLAGMTAPGRPVANLLFLGPTGSGKTRMVEAGAEILFGTADAVIKIDCAEFQHSHEIAKLIGSPPGYLGHRETSPALTQDVINHYQTETLKLSLVLFDEIEKASDALWQLLLGILDKATLTLGDNRRVDLSACLIVLTSNLGTGEMNDIMEGGLGFAKSRKPEHFDTRLDDKITRAAQEAARRKFSPEFMNRIDKIVVFKTLKPEHLEQILEIELGMVQQRILQATGNNQFVFSCTQKVKRFLLDEGTDPKYGARHLKRAIEKNIVFPLANLVATSQIRLGDFIRIDMKDNALTFTKEAEGALVPVLLEKYGNLNEPNHIAARAGRGTGKSRDFGGIAPLLDHK